MTLVEKIENWSRIFGAPVKQEKGFPDQSRISLSLKLIREELKEAEEAIAFKDFKETQDGLGDLLWVVVRAMMEFGIDPEDVIEKIYESNMSKADLTEDDATITYKKYMEEGVQTYCREREGVYITYRLPDHKILKSYKFKEPEL